MYLQSENRVLFWLYYQIKFEYLVKNALQNDDNGDLLADSCTILNLWGRTTAVIHWMCMGFV